MYITLIALAISTILNTVYFLKTVIRIYTPISKEEETEKNYTHLTFKDAPLKSVALVIFIIINLTLGLASGHIVELIEAGLSMFM